ncbi:MAG: dienelactone hydrolase family protein [Bacteroidota bacterium]|jgi:carboxymethylenebutenolidase
MKKISLFSAVILFSTLLVSHQPAHYRPDLLTPDCYVSCFTTEVTDGFRMEAMSPAFAALHPLPRKYKVQQPKGERIRFQASDGTEAYGYEIKSKRPTQNWIFVIQEWWGMNENIIREAEELAAELGNVNVLALDMYDGKVAATPDSAMKLVQGATRDRLEKIVRAGISHAGSSARIFTIGWCFGGMWSLQSSLLAGQQAAGCVMYYGRPENNLEKLKTLQCDVLGIFGSKDRSPSPEIVRKFEEDMRVTGKNLSLHFYDAGHGFANPSNPAFDQVATADARKKALAFLRERMK